MLQTVDVKPGTASVLYGGALRLSVSSVYETYAVMGIFTPDRSCDNLFPSVGRTMAMMASDEVTYEITLLGAVADKEIHVEVRRRAPAPYEALSCPTPFS